MQIDKEGNKMFHLVKKGCHRGFAFVRDNTGNKLFYGTIKECYAFIRFMNSNTRNWKEVYKNV